MMNLVGLWFLLGLLTVTQSKRYGYSPQTTYQRHPYLRHPYLRHPYLRHPYLRQPHHSWVQKQQPTTYGYKFKSSTTNGEADQAAMVGSTSEQGDIITRTAELAGTPAPLQKEPQQETAPNPQQIAESLIQFVNRPLQPKGEPLPKIPGPKKDDRVCIVGAGPAGVHMALRLKELDYKNVDIFEASGYVGGKAKDYIHQNFSYALGALILYRTYTENVVPLFEKYSPTEFRLYTDRNIKQTNTASECDVATASEYLFPKVGQLTGLTDPRQIGARIVGDVKKYYQIHQEMFGGSDGYLMNKPSKEVLYRIRGTLKDFLEREGLESLIPIMLPIIHSYLYGSLEEGSMYFLLEPGNSIPLSVALSVLGAKQIPYSPFEPIDTTFATLFKTIVEKERLNVKYHRKVVNLRHTSLGNILLDIDHKGSSQLLREPCDFVIWTALATQLLKNYPVASEEEKRLFGSLYTHEAASSVVRKMGDVRAGPSTHYAEGKKKRGDTLAVHSEGYQGDRSVQNIYRNLTTLEEWRNDRQSKISLVYQEGLNYLEDDLVENELRNHFKSLGATDIDILTSEKWDYFPRWSANDLEGKHWEVFDIQGKRKIWYAGSSVSFETVVSVVDYNNLLLKQME